MRTVKQLLLILLENQNLFDSGLCRWSRNLNNNDLITDEEDHLLHDYIRYHRPWAFSSYDTWKQRKTSFYWKYFSIEPRIKWINKHIKKLKNE